MRASWKSIQKRRRSCTIRLRPAKKDDAVGLLEQEIVKITEGQQVDYEIRFEKPMKDIAKSFMRTDSIAPDQTLVKWQISGHMNYPFNIIGLFMDKMIGGDLETGLQNLKKIKEM